MCGIAGIVGNHIDESVPHSAIQNMTEALAHRGPNAQGVWRGTHCLLGHRRLSIIDLSEAGHQPFKSQDGRYVLVYNGELYNYKALKLELQRAEYGSGHLPYLFKTSSDTEVVLAAYLRWGTSCLQRFNGMFAFAIWDNRDEKLMVARDRLGVKPLYYQLKNKTLLFASEIRALMQSGLIKKKTNAQSVAEYVQYATVHAPKTILQDVLVLMPGHFLEFRPHHSEFKIQPYWDINQFTKNKQELSYQDTCKQINKLLTDAVERRLVADVPFGAFLSGGIDSSAVVGLMSQVSSEKIRTFNVSFDEHEFSESRYARQIASKFNTEHHEIKLTPNDFLQQLPEALHAIDHPSGDGPNSYIVSKATKQAGITMALSGLGGDELFAGYSIFKQIHALEKKAWLNIIPRFGRKWVGNFIATQKNSIQGDKIKALLDLLSLDAFNAYPINRKLFNPKDYTGLLHEPVNTDHFITQLLTKIKTDKTHVLSKVSLFEIHTYLQNVLLRDTDQMSMAVALEVREPFLDHTLVEFVLGIKDEYKYPHTPKQLLVDALGNLLPNDLVNRPKMGFVLPWKTWLKEDLKDFCAANINEFANRSFVNKEYVQLIWHRFLHNDPKITWSRVWHLIVLNHWLTTHHIED